MPIYEYQCQACGHQFETTQRITEDPLKDCPVCNKPELTKLISATSFRLRGSGWYKDGYGNPNKKRTDNQVHDRLQKAIDDDKKKTTEASDSSAAGDSSSAAESSSDSSSGGSTGGTPSSGGGTS